MSAGLTSMADQNGQQPAIEEYPMTLVTACRLSLGSWLDRHRQAFSDQLHAEGDAFGQAQGWEITRSTGRFGFGAREYRDPRFAARRAGGEGRGYPA